jgi:uncharacterized protein YrrD
MTSEINNDSCLVSPYLATKCPVFLFYQGNSEHFSQVAILEYFKHHKWISFSNMGRIGMDMILRSMLSPTSRFIYSKIILSRLQ